MESRDSIKSRDLLKGVSGKCIVRNCLVTELLCLLSLGASCFLSGKLCLVLNFGAMFCA